MNCHFSVRELNEIITQSAVDFRQTKLNAHGRTKQFSIIVNFIVTARRCPKLDDLKLRLRMN